MKQGSCCLTIIIAMALLGAVYIGYCHATHLFARYVHESITSATHEELTKGVLNFGIAHVTKHFDTMIKDDASWQEQFIFDQHVAVLELRANNKNVEILAVLSQEGHQVCRMSCSVHKTEDHKLIIRGFQRRTISLY